MRLASRGAFGDGAGDSSDDDKDEDGMCLACSPPARSGHWADAVPAQGPTSALQALQALLSADGLTIRPSALAGGLRLAATSGRAMIAPTLDHVWPAVRELTGETVDPLAARFVERGREIAP